MTDERDKSSRAKESLARTTARDVPLVRGAGSESEPAPRGQRPGQLPRDPTYEAELAQVELAVMRDPARRDDPSTKQGGGRRAHEYTAGQPPESVTPESPGTRNHADIATGRSPEPPSSGGRSVASGTLLSVGAVDPRGKTERTLETPRMFFSQLDDSGEAYFRPGKIPAVTVHQTLETETVKLADSIDPRRAKTIPRLDRAQLAKMAEGWREPDSEAPVARSAPASDFEQPESSIPRPWDGPDYEPVSSLGERDHDRQIHASLSPFREQAEASFSLDGAVTRPEPYVARRASDPPESTPAPEQNAIPTQRDLPAHRIEASLPPPAPVSRAGRTAVDSTVPLSEGVSPTTASIAAEEPRARAAWPNYAAFAVALVLAVAFGMWLTRGSEPQQAAPNAVEKAASVRQAPVPPVPTLPVADADTAPAPAALVAPTPAAVPAPAVAPAPRKENTASAKPTPASPAPATPSPASPSKSTPSKSPRETIF